MRDIEMYKDISPNKLVHIPNIVTRVRRFVHLYLHFRFRAPNDEKALKFLQSAVGLATQTRYAVSAREELTT